MILITQGRRRCHRSIQRVGLMTSYSTVIKTPRRLSFTILDSQLFFESRNFYNPTCIYTPPAVGDKETGISPAFWVSVNESSCSMVDLRSFLCDDILTV